MKSKIFSADCVVKYIVVKVINNQSMFTSANVCDSVSKNVLVKPTYYK